MSKIVISLRRLQNFNYFLGGDVQNTSQPCAGDVKNSNQPSEFQYFFQVVMSEILVSLRNELQQSPILPLDYAEARDKVFCINQQVMSVPLKVKFTSSRKNANVHLIQNCVQVLLAARLQSAHRQGFLNSIEQVFIGSLLRFFARF